MLCFGAPSTVVETVGRGASFMATRSTQRRHEKNRAAVRAFKHPSGTPVEVERANGIRFRTFTTSLAFLLDGAHAFVQVEGIPGNTRLSRVTPIPKAERKGRR